MSNFDLVDMAFGFGFIAGALLVLAVWWYSDNKM